MTHEVILTEQAERDIDGHYTWWVRHRSATQADRWYYKFGQEIVGLGARPTHRVLFVVHPKRVIVLRVRHLAQETLGADDF